MQAIVTKYAGPSNVRGTRVIAKCNAKRIIVPWDHALNSDENHDVAAIMLAQKLGWYGTLVGGSLPHSMGGNCYVFLKRSHKSKKVRVVRP